MKPSQIAKALHAVIQQKQAAFLWGEPGVGKSAVVRQVTESLPGHKLIDVRLTLLDSVDLRGFPYRDGNRMRFASPDFLPTDINFQGTLFLDEMNKAEPAVQSAAYQLVLDRKLGEYTLPPGCAIIAAGNRETDQSAVYTMAAALANRFIHLEYDPDFGDWRKWAMNEGISQEVINFINFRPGLLHDFDPEKRAFPTPRSWEAVHNILGSCPDEVVERNLISGAVGDGAEAEFTTFLKIYRNLPDPDSVLLAPMQAAVPTDLATLYALCGALANRANENNFGRLLEYCGRLDDDFQVLCIRDAVVRNRELANTTEFSNWAIKNADVLI
jgi:hypothetical protein